MKDILGRLLRFALLLLIVAAGLAGVAYQKGKRAEAQKKAIEESMERRLREGMNEAVSSRRRASN